MPQIKPMDSSPHHPHQPHKHKRGHSRESPLGEGETIPVSPSPNDPPHLDFTAALAQIKRIKTASIHTASLLGTYYINFLCDSSRSLEDSEPRVANLIHDLDAIDNGLEKLYIPLMNAIRKVNPSIPDQTDTVIPKIFADTAMLRAYANGSLKESDHDDPDMGEAEPCQTYSSDQWSTALNSLIEDLGNLEDLGDQDGGEQHSTTMN